MIHLNTDQGILRDGKMYYSEPPCILFIKCPKETILPVFKNKTKYVQGKKGGMRN